MRSATKKLLLYIFALAFSPLIVVASPFWCPAVVAVVVINIARAADWNPRCFIWLSLEVVLHIKDVIVKFLPVLLSVRYHYSRQSNSRALRSNIPYGMSDAWRTPSTFQNIIGAAVLETPQWALSLKERCKLDVYPCVGGGHLRPVLLFIYGGAWGGGEKWYYTSFATAIRSQCNVVVVVADYPHYPLGTMVDMEEAVHNALCWAEENIALYGGDPKRIWLMGHSAGAHLCAAVAMRRAIAIAHGSENELLPSLTARGVCAPPISLTDFMCSPVQRPTGARHPLAMQTSFREGPNIVGMILFSGVYDLEAHYKHETRRCVQNISTMRGATDGYWAAHSPVTMLREYSENNNSVEPRSNGSNKAEKTESRLRLRLEASQFPRVFLFHDPSDTVVPIESSQQFRDALLQAMPGASMSDQFPPVTLLKFGHSDGIFSVSPSLRCGVHPTISAIQDVLQR